MSKYVLPLSSHEFKQIMTALSKTAAYFYSLADTAKESGHYQPDQVEQFIKVAKGYDQLYSLLLKKVSK